MENETLEEQIKSYHEKIRTLEKESCRIGGEIIQLTKEQAELIQKDALKNIGRCFKYYNNDILTHYVKVTGVPKIKETMTEVQFDEYQYRAFYIRVKDYDINFYHVYKNRDEKDDTPFYYDRFFVGNFENNGLPWEKWEEISDEEFCAFFDVRINDLKNNVKKSIDKAK